MDMHFSEQENAFRQEVREFLRTNAPESLRRNFRAGRRQTKQEMVDWQRVLNKRGWATPHWPKEWGGAALSPVKRFILGEEMALAGVPDVIGFNSRMIGPALLAFGTEAQKAHFLPKIANLDIWFCQGFSEPGSGSDLASLRSAAVRDGDHYVINGHKIWTSHAHRADWMFGLFRTDPAARKQRGISFILLDMKSPGITVKPIITLDGLHETNEVFLDNVRVPVGNLVGVEHRGWDVAKSLLSNERLSSARPGVATSRVERARRLAQQVQVDGRPLAENQQFRERLAAIEVELKAFEITSLRALDAAQKDPDGTRPDPYSSMLKLKTADLQQQLDELLVLVAGPHTLRYNNAALTGDGDPAETEDDWRTIVPNYLFKRVSSIAGGSNEIQKNIISKTILGL